MESDYHDAMNAECYEKYFENVCKLFKPRSVIIIDNASYHSRNDENYPSQPGYFARDIEMQNRVKLLTKMQKDMGMKSCGCLHTTVISTQLS